MYRGCILIVVEGCLKVFVRVLYIGLRRGKNFRKGRRLSIVGGVGIAKGSFMSLMEV